MSLEIGMQFRILQELFSGITGSTGDSVASPDLLLGFQDNTGITWSVTSSAYSISGKWSLRAIPSVSQGVRGLGTTVPKSPICTVFI